MQIILKGKASQKEFYLKVVPEYQGMSLMDFLRSQGFPIASSCDGVAVCKKCVIQDGILSCGLSVLEFLQERPDGIVIIDYL